MIAAALTLVATAPALGQSQPSYDSASMTQCIPFANFQAQGTPDKNVLLNLRSINGQPIVDGALNAGYIIGRQGIQVGLTAANTSGFRFAKLAPYAQYPGDWMIPQGCITVNPEVNRNANGAICTPAGILSIPGSRRAM
ncbi:hypothetical protein [Azospirillum sp. B506]|uniref:hypothetical protein n=1 Tax=Azospirillum sp. B506 TaxID=137721 RepID=UPI0003483AB7|nr:hypothetical protein [Azospirillum sp. B506]